MPPRIARHLLLTLAVLLLAPAGAQAFTFVSYDGTNGLTITSDGADSALIVNSSAPPGGPETYHFDGPDASSALLISGCSRTVNGTAIDCPITGARKLTATLGGGRDILQTGGDLGPANIQGQDGDDVLGGDLMASPLTLDGGAGADVLIGGPQADTLLGGDGPDLIHLGAGADVAQGGNGNDQLFMLTNPAAAGEPPESAPAPDVADGGPGTDLATYAAVGQDLNLSLDGVANDGRAGEGDNLIAIEDLQGGTGNDVITGDGGPNSLTGETLQVLGLGAGNDVIHGGGGNDRITGHVGNDQVFGDDGDDGVYGGSGNDVVDGGPGNDAIADDRQTVVVGGQPFSPVSNDTTGPDGDDTMRGGDGNDFIAIGPGNNSLDAGTGDDQVVSASLPAAGQTWEMGAGNDKVFGTGGGDITVNGGAGNDLLFGQGGGNQTLNGGSGDDLINGFAGDDVETGGPGDDLIGDVNGSSNLITDKDPGKDVMQGGSGADLLISSDGDVDNVDCGTNPTSVINKPGLTEPENDQLKRDLVDNPVVNCEQVQNGNRKEGPFIRISRAKRSIADAVAVRLTCPAKLKIACDGTLQAGVITARGTAGGLGPKSSYRLAHGASRVLRVRLRPADQARLRAAKGSRLRLVSLEKGEHGPKTVVALVSVKR